MAKAKKPRVSTHPMKVHTARTKALTEKLRRICMALPDVTEKIACRHRRDFARMHRNADRRIGNRRQIERSVNSAESARIFHHYRVAGGVEYPAAVLGGDCGAPFAKPRHGGDCAGFVGFGHG